VILILDNGGAYSDHQIHFIDCDGMDPDEVLRLFILTRCRYQKPFEIGRAESIEWRDSKAFAKPEDSIDDLEDDDEIDFAELSDRALSILAAKTYETDARDRIAAEQLRRES